MIYEMFSRGGPIMWLLLGCSIAGVALILERAIFWILESRRLDVEELESFFDRIHRGKLEGAYEMAEKSDSDLLARLARAWDQHGSRALVEAFDLAINRIEKRSQRYLFALKTIVSVSPLLGILGTVIGIIQSFEVLGSAGAAADPQAVGAGLAQALITTAFGLIIAVPCLIVHNYFLAKSRNYVDRLDGFADELVFHVGDEGAQVEPDESEHSPTNGRNRQEATP